jgi:hypothetical protein
MLYARRSSANLFSVPPVTSNDFEAATQRGGRLCGPTREFFQNRIDKDRTEIEFNGYWLWHCGIPVAEITSDWLKLPFPREFRRISRGKPNLAWLGFDWL